MLIQMSNETSVGCPLWLLILHPRLPVVRKHTEEHLVRVDFFHHSLGKLSKQGETSRNNVENKVVTCLYMANRWSNRRSV